MAALKLSAGWISMAVGGNLGQYLGSSEGRDWRE